MTVKVVEKMLVGYERLGILRPGDEVTYKAGVDQYSCEARCTISEYPGFTDVYVKVEEVIQQGTDVKPKPIEVGDIILAGTLELWC